MTDRPERAKHLPLHRLPAWLTAIYRPQPAPPYVGPVLSAAVAAIALARGSQLVVRGSTSELLAYVDYVGTATWGWLFMAAGAGILAALASRGLFVLLLAHMFGAALSFGYLVSLVQGAVAAEAPTWQGIVQVMVGLALHLIRLDMFRRSFPVYRDPTRPGTR